MSQPECWDDIIDPPISELFIDGENVFLNAFTQHIFANLNMGLLKLLKLPDGISSIQDIQNYEIEFPIKAEIKTFVDLKVNGQLIKMKSFIHVLIRGYNLGIIESLQKIPESFEKVKIKYTNRS